MDKLEEKNEKLFGDVFAGEERKLPDVNNPEPNTDLEKLMIKHIVEYVENGDTITRKMANAMVKILDTDLYPDMFRKPNQTEVYRGMNLTHEQFDKFLSKAGIYGDLSKGHIVRTLKEPAVYKPLPGNTTSSWTKSQIVASRFANNEFKTGVVNPSDEDGGVALIVIAQLSDNPNRFLDLEGFYDYFIKSKFHSEQEALGIGPIVITKIQWKIIG